MKEWRRIGMRDKLIELIKEVAIQYLDAYANAGKIADFLIANGVTFADVPDNNVGDKWIPISERLPEPFVSVLVQMPGEEPCPTVREGFLTNDGEWYAGHFARLKDEVTHWMPMPEPPKEKANDTD
jgi:hypothetical protein